MQDTFCWSVLPEMHKM